jgi:hypothetical protein
VAFNRAVRGVAQVSRELFDHLTIQHTQTGVNV